MAKRGERKQKTEVRDYRHEEARRVNIPEAGLAAHGQVREAPKARYAYDPHLPPALRYDATGAEDRLPELLEAAQRRPLSEAEARTLAEALRNRQPWLEWAGKREARWFEVDPLALHIHERVSTQAILKLAQREPVQRTLFGDPEMEYHKAVQFYQHDVDWSNRLILGDSLSVMHSLAKRENLAGKVQMIYVDPPYGIKFASNFQPEVGRRDVRDRDDDLTREPEQVKAYRDTWTLGVHSYLAYLRDRLMVARELLAETGSIFVQISDENVHHVRELMDGVFGRDNFVAVVVFTKTSGQTARYLPSTCDYLVWYCKEYEQLKYRNLLMPKSIGENAGTYVLFEAPWGEQVRASEDEERRELESSGWRAFSLGDVTSQRQGRPSGPGSAMYFPVEVHGQEYRPFGDRGWTTTAEGMMRLSRAERLQPLSTRIRYKRFLADFPGLPISNLWGDIGGASDRVYVVQTNGRVIERCMLMTTDPGDLVLDPTCVRKGTGVWVAEEAPPLSPRRRGEGGVSSPCERGEAEGEALFALALSPLAGRVGVGALSPEEAPPLSPRRRGEGDGEPLLAPAPSLYKRGKAEGEALPAPALSPPVGRAGVGALSPEEAPPLSPRRRGEADGEALPAPAPCPPVGRVGVGSPSPLAGRAGEGALSPEEAPPLSPRKRGEDGLSSPCERGEGVSAPAPSPLAGRDGVGDAPIPRKLHAIESIRAGQWVFAHDGLPHCVLRTIRRPYRGLMIGLRHKAGDETLWLTADHRVLARTRPRFLGGHRDWSGSPRSSIAKRQRLRREMTPPERLLWQALRDRASGVKFRRQHPIGPYIADLYSREASLVVEVDGAEAHGSEEAQLYDRERDEYMAALGLRVLRVPAREVLHNLDGVYEAIQHACAERLDAAGAAWVPAVDLQVGDLVFVGPERRAVPLAEVRREQCEEEVWDLEVEGAHSFITQVCAVHNCGSGTTAYVAEQWGRRWITIDTSRVAVALARQRLLTAKYDYYTLADEAQGVAGGFVYRTVPHIMLSTISQCTALDPIFHRWEPVLAERLAALNGALAGVDEATRTRLQAKLAEKERREGKRAVTEADQRRWLLPREGWQEWEAPYDADPDWPEGLRAALEAYRQAWREKMDEVNATIAVSAPQEALYDQPEVTPGVLRVSGPFTVEGVQPVEMGLEESPIGGAPEEMGTFAPEAEPANAEAYLQRMIRLLRQDGVRFPNNVVQTFERLEAVSGGLLHAEGEWGANGDTRRVAVSVGPQYGPVTAKQVEECLREAYRRGYDDLVFAGFAFDGAAQAIIQEDANPKVRCHLAHIRPDVNMGDLLKDTAGSQLFTVFGLPRVALKRAKGGEYVVEMQGVDVYDPVSNTIQATGASKVAAWFLDQDYDGRCFCISQAFFPDESAWDKLARALRSVVDPARFAAFSGTRSLPFGAGTHKRIAVKVIDPRGNEVMRVMGLDGEGSYG